MEEAAPNIQNEFFNQVRREKRRVLVFLNSGKRLMGRIKSFDKFTILLETSQGDQMIFKHAIATVGQAGATPRAGFRNRIEFEAPSRGRSAQPAASRAADAPEPEPSTTDSGPTRRD